MSKKTKEEEYSKLRTGRDEEEIKRLTVLAETDFYHIMIRKWVTFVAIGLIAEVIGGLTSFVIILARVQIPLPTFKMEIIPLDLHSLVTTLFSASITISGIILGFFAVCVFFFLEYCDRKIDDLSERSDKENDKVRTTKYQLRTQIFWNARNGFSRYASTFVRICISLMLLQITSFIFSFVSPFFLFVNLIIDFNLLLVITSGLYPATRGVFW